jgi:tetratricopeptide (TPR) repeat protein
VAEAVEQAHISIETLARWLAGDLAHGEVLREIVPHLLERCEDCRRLKTEIAALQEEYEHWDERVAVFEGRQAPGLVTELETLSLEEQLSLVEREERFQTWGVAHLLLTKSFEAGFEDPVRAVGLAELAVRVTELLVEEAYDPHWVLDLRAKSWAYLGNARRILGELWSAEACFRKTDTYLAASMTGNQWIHAEVLDLRASLRRAQRRFSEALDLLEQAIALYRELGEIHRVGRCLLNKAKINEEIGDLDTGIRLLEEASGLIARQREPRLVLCVHQNLVLLLSAAGRYSEAEALLPELRRLSQEIGNRLDLLRLRWAEGKVDRGLGRRGPAEAAFREVQRELMERRMGYDAALVCLDLAILYAEEGATAELKHLAVEVMPVFESREVQREAMAALILFQHACQEEQLTAGLARQIAEVLRRERGAQS